ncbi:preprotein translocase subunit SecD/SecF [Pseudidiomarina salinarum]|uniref:Multifunctional fusion protein n=1 Tax=Pseudidiomarina salinarum TaxID=435908 RepID=A0A094L6F9_9GAMM|nr:protein translocase subunit SecD [Pseudidiomarina salinarum]KFZ30313.1 preprotein translocase subunit SecD/SecF [Pseudidiomarina salinarum]RUO70014.1 protein translocase subunit SecDF [Pseudidiomarina salinarum]
MKSLLTRAVVYGLVIVLGLLSALPNFLSPNLSAKLPDWYQQNTMSLGLDLQGGSHLLLEVDTDALFASEYQAIADELTKSLRQAEIHYGRMKVTDEAIELPLRQAERLSEAATLARKLATDTPDGARRFNVEQEGGSLVLTLTDTWREHLSRDGVERSLEVVRRRLDETGLVDPSITRQGSDGILVQMPGVADPSDIRELLGTTAKMTFHWVALDGWESGGGVFTLPGAGEQAQYQLEERVAMAGERIRDAHMAFDPETGEPVVNFKLDNEGARQFGEMTRDNIGRLLAIVLDEEVITAPVIRTEIAGGSGQISGAFTTKEANSLALMLRAGALPAPLYVIEERTVGPDLGSDAIEMGLTTGLLGAGMVIAFMVALYGRWGLIACIGLTVNIGLVFGILSLLGATLTLPGIAGIILTVGMAVDANILINERIREESRRGKRAAMALREGFGKAYSTIMDSNFTTLIAVSLLFLFGSGPVKGFAVTIGIGLLTSLFTAIAVTRLIMEWRIRGRERESLVISGIAWLDRLSERGVNFMRGRVMGLVVSAALSLAAIALFVHPGLKYGVDFTGGTVVEVQTQGITVDHLRHTLQANQLEDTAIQEVGSEGRFLIRMPAEHQTPGATAEQVSLLKSAVTSIDPTAEFPKVDMVGPKVSGGFSDATILAILLAGSGMLVYLWFRFESHFALAATVTIALDLTKTIGFFVLAGVEFNLTAVAALLALIGYSINDKVVVFDRIRENIRKTPEKPMLELLNESISSTLTRTVFTSVTTFLALLPMGIAGGAAVASFALPMLFAIVIGTSSSIFIASPILYYLGQRRMRKGLAQLRPTDEQIRKELELMP